jgi:hypothetical protein
MTLAAPLQASSEARCAVSPRRDALACSLSLQSRVCGGHDCRVDQKRHALRSIHAIAEMPRLCAGSLADAPQSATPRRTATLRALAAARSGKPSSVGPVRAGRARLDGECARGRAQRDAIASSHIPRDLPVIGSRHGLCSSSRHTERRALRQPTPARAHCTSSWREVTRAGGTSAGDLRAGSFELNSRRPLSTITTLEMPCS